MREEAGAREAAPIVIMGSEKRVKTAESITRRKPRRAVIVETAPEIRQVSTEDARNEARQEVLRSAAEVIRQLIAKSGGNYLTVKFLFEFAGLMGDGADEAPEPSPLLKYYLDEGRNDVEEGVPEQTGERNLNLFNEQCSNNCR
ncbi:MAG TPA: hypothetical protein VD837_13215 [Terriglobales bacterium]|nr:hypothetical protein [Terriglobales bacterium]